MKQQAITDARFTKLMGLLLILPHRRDYGNQWQKPERQKGVTDWLRNIARFIPGAFRLLKC